MFIILTLAFWLGLYALRSYVPSAVWNMADELPLSYKPVFAVATHAVGMLGIIAVHLLRRRAFDVLVIVFVLITVARQAFLTVDSVGPWLSLLSWISWLWFMMALANEVSAQDGEKLIAPALAAAVALQLGMQAAWHGLDLPSVSGPLAIAGSILLAAVLWFNVWRLPRMPLPRPDASIAWIFVGVAFFLEATLIGSAGRFSQITGWSLPIAIGVLQLALLLAVIVAERATAFWIRVVFIVIGFIAVFGIPGLTGFAAAVLLAVQVVTICALRETAERRVRRSAAALFTIGALIFFLLIFGFYNSYELTPLWILAFAAMAVGAALAQRSGGWPARNVLLAFAPAFVLLTLYFIPPPDSPVAAGEDLRILSYNIHQGFNDDGVPGMQKTVEEIARMQPDLIALQEIGRGWTLLGGNDLVAYLAWRFPQHSIHFTPINGQLWGNAIMSRLPVITANGTAFDAEAGIFRYGYAHALIEHPLGNFLFLSVHLTSDLEGPDDKTRLEQAQQVLHHVWPHVIRQGTRAVVAGDFNAFPTDTAIREFNRTLTDLGGEAGLSELATWSAGAPDQRIDYIFGSGFRAVQGSIPRITTSDHLPVLLTLRPTHTTRTLTLPSNRQPMSERPTQ